MRVRLAVVVSLAVVMLACPKKDAPPEATADPPPKASSNASASASASGTAGMLASAVSSGLTFPPGTQGMCVDGLLSGYPTSPLLGTDAGAGGGVGGLGLVGSSGGGGFGRIKGSVVRRIVVGVLGKEVTGPQSTLIARALCDITPKIRKCYDDARVANPTAAGNVELGLDILATGIITAKITSGALDPVAQECVRAAVATATAPGAAVSTSYTLTFQVPQKQVSMKETGTTVTGKLPPEVIRRIIRANFPRLRHCYETGLKKDPALAGKVSVKFVIDKTGAVGSVAEEAGATLADATARTCMVAVFKTLSFPEPEGGTVSVTYPIEFSNGG